MPHDLPVCEWMISMLVMVVLSESHVCLLWTPKLAKVMNSLKVPQCGSLIHVHVPTRHCVRLCTLSLCTRCRSYVVGLTPPPHWASWSQECPPSHCGRTCVDWSSSDRHTGLYCGPAKMQTGKITKGLYAVRTEFNCRFLSSFSVYQCLSCVLYIAFYMYPCVHPLLLPTQACQHTNVPTCICCLPIYLSIYLSI